MRLAIKEGYWLVLLISFIALPVRGVIAAYVIGKWGVYPCLLYTSDAADE